MSPEIIFVEEETRVGEIAMLLSERNIKRAPVMRDGQLVGIVCRADIVHAVAQGHHRWVQPLDMVENSIGTLRTPFGWFLHMR